MNNEFFLSPAQMRQRERFVKKSSQTAAKYLRRMRELPDAPKR